MRRRPPSSGARPRLPLGRTLLAATVLLGALATPACATYRDDLDRSMGHYQANEYAKALSLLEVLEGDLDSLSKPERARYAYYRGMSHFRLTQRRDARHWLGRSAAREKASKGALSSEENKRVADTLADLNKDRWGGADTPATDEGKPCAADNDCVKGQFCDAGTCKASPNVEPPPPAGTEPPPPKETTCASDADCQAGQTCRGGVCTAAAAPCATDNDCQGDRICENGACAAPAQ
ncbi:MAG: hypothetical protein JRI68_01900 [Deltaproteobacteria bacterium]|nr:hypothetical protein [Deltaproteobacteria bacterium]